MLIIPLLRSTLKTTWDSGGNPNVIMLNGFNKQKLSFEIDFNRITISKNLKVYLKKYKKIRTHYFFKGDDYQILFTAPQKNRSLISSIGKRMNQRFTIIGKINNRYKKNSIKIGNKPLNLSKFNGYSHKF